MRWGLGGAAWGVRTWGREGGKGGRAVARAAQRQRPGPLPPRPRPPPPPNQPRPSPQAALYNIACCRSRLGDVDNGLVALAGCVEQGACLAGGGLGARAGRLVLMARLACARAGTPIT